MDWFVDAATDRIAGEHVVMIVLLGALLAGALTTLAPCVLPMLPVIVGGSVVGVGPDVAPADAALARRAARRRAYLIVGSLGVSVAAFTLLLKASTYLLRVPTNTWSIVSGVLLIALGLISLFPQLWDRISAAVSLQSRTNTQLAKARNRGGTIGDVLTGFALGPVFSSCSPLYGYLIVTVLPSDFWYGFALLIAYVVGLCVTLLAIALAGQQLLRNVRWIADPHGWVRRGLGAIFVIVGIAVLTGWDRDIQAWIIEHSPIRPWQLDSGFIPGT